MAKTKANLGWSGGGFVAPFTFTSDVKREIHNKIPSLVIERLESVVAGYIQTRESFKDKPTIAERKANLKLFADVLRQCSKLLSYKGLDQISRDHIQCHLAVAGKADLWSECKEDLHSLWLAVIKEQHTLGDTKGGRPVNTLHRDLAQQIYNVLGHAGVNTTSTQTGPFCFLLELVLREVNEEKQDVHKLARLIINRNKPSRAKALAND